MTTDRRDTIAGGFTETASDYDGAVRYNIEGAQRLVLSMPPGRYLRSTTHTARQTSLRRRPDVSRASFRNRSVPSVGVCPGSGEYDGRYPRS
jgi:hypothetical protein